jgi:hypothetical protein
MEEKGNILLYQTEEGASTFIHKNLYKTAAKVNNIFIR